MEYTLGEMAIWFEKVPVSKEISDAVDNMIVSCHELGEKAFKELLERDEE